MSPLIVILNGDRAGERVGLEPLKKYVIGRDKTAQICLPEKKVSRQHAILTWNAELNEILLEDLGSLNGTILNGDPVKGTVPLHHQDRFQIGSFLLQVDFARAQRDSEPSRPTAHESKSATLSKNFLASVEDDVESPSTAVDDTGGRFLQGKLSEIPFSDLLQMLCSMKKSGYLWVSKDKLDRLPKVSELGADLGLVVINSGELVYARYDSVENEEAVYEVLKKESGHFALFPKGRDKFKSSIGMPVEAILLEGFRRIDEERASRRDFQADDTFEVNPAESLLTLQPEELTLFQIAWKFKKFEKILKNSPVDNERTRELLSKLLRSGFIKKV